MMLLEQYWIGLILVIFSIFLQAKVPCMKLVEPTYGPLKQLEYWIEII